MIFYVLFNNFEQQSVVALILCPVLASRAFIIGLYPNTKTIYFIMKKYLLPLICAAFASTAIFAQTVDGAPRVSPGDFYCFPGMDASSIDFVENSPSRLRKAMRVDKLGNSKWDNTDGHDIREVPTQGDYKVLVILVDFADARFSVNNGDPYPLVNNMLNGENYDYNGATGSANAFYRTISNGQFNPQFNLYGPVHLDHNEDYYVRTTDGTRPNYPKQYYTDPNDPSKEIEVYYPGLMVKEAVEKLNGEINFADYDSNGDGMVDFVYFFHAGKGATTGGDPKKVIWPHAFTLNSALGQTVSLDGVEVNRYATSAELGRNNKLSGIGTFTHEFAHVLGLPDLYDTANNGSASKCFTPGTFDCMDGGNYNNNEHTPPLFSGYERYALEWMLPVTITGSADITLLPLSARNFAYKVETSRPQEYFILEARAPYGNDKFIEGWGLAAWHIDFNLDVWNRNSPNNSASHQRIDIIEADNQLDASSRSGDLFPGTQAVCEFQSNVSPNFIDWNNKSTGYEISKIASNFDGTVTLTITADSGKKMEGSSIDAPQPIIRSTGSDSFFMDWEPVKGAKGYMVSVYEADKCDGISISEYVDGFYFKDIENETSITVEGLLPGVEYNAMVYAYNDVNASRAAYPVSTTALAADFEKASPNIYLYADNGVADIRWDAIEDADDYKLTVAQLSDYKTSVAESTGFDNTDIPIGWSSNARFEYRDRYCGESSPALKMETNGLIIRTPLMDKDIHSLSFTGRIQYDEDPYTLDVYGQKADGTSNWILRYSEMDASLKSHEIVIPEGYRQISLFYNMLATGQFMFMDDVKVNIADSYTTEVVPEDAVNYAEPTRAFVSGLKPDTEYVAYVTPLKDNKEGMTSRKVAFRISQLPSEVEDIYSELTGNGFTTIGMTVIPANEDMEYDVYSIDGMILAGNHRGNITLPSKGIYVLRSAGKSLKISL